MCHVIELDDGKILTGKPDQFDGKNHGFRLRYFPQQTNPVINPTQTISPSAIIQHFQGTMIMGADVCHKVAGISVAAVVGTTDFSFVPWLQSWVDKGIYCHIEDEHFLNFPDVILERFWGGLDLDWFPVFFWWVCFFLGIDLTLVNFPEMIFWEFGGNWLTFPCETTATEWIEESEKIYILREIIIYNILEDMFPSKYGKSK